MSAASRLATPTPPALADRVARLDWAGIGEALDAQGFATTPALLDAAECDALAALYPEEAPFRSRVVMQRHNFGRGEYKYFRYPLPPDIDALRHAIYPRLVPIANRWSERLNDATRFPAGARRVSCAVPRGGTATPDAAAPQIRRGRLQLPSPGSLRGADLPAPDDHPARRARRRVRRRRVPHRRATAAGTVEGRGRAITARRGGDLRGAPSSGAGHARQPTASTSATASAGSARGNAAASASFSTMPANQPGSREITGGHGKSRCIRSLARSSGVVLRRRPDGHYGGDTTSIPMTTIRDPFITIGSALVSRWDAVLPVHPIDRMAFEVAADGGSDGRKEEPFANLRRKVRIA